MKPEEPSEVPSKKVLLTTGKIRVARFCKANKLSLPKTTVLSKEQNDAEWFAEIMRVFITNHALLKLLRPKAHQYILQQFTPVSDNNWEQELGEDVPARIVKSLKRKIEACR